MKAPAKRRAWNSTCPAPTRPITRSTAKRKRKSSVRNHNRRDRKAIARKSCSPAEFERKYGPEDYQEFTRAQPCACCGWVGATQICHAQTGGTGRKDDWTQTFPGCGPHQIHTSPWSTAWDEGCNTEPERVGRQTFEKTIGHTLLELAAIHQAKYAAHLAAQAGR